MRPRSGLRLRASFLVTLLLATLLARGAWAANDDVAGQTAATQILNDEYSSANFVEAKKKANSALDRCNKKGAKCQPSTKAQLYILLGMSASQIGQNDDARAAFTNALKEDPDAKLPTTGTTPNIRSQFADVQKAMAPPPAPAPAAEDTAAVAAPTPGMPTPLRAPPGWNNAEAFQLASAGLTADLAGKLDECIEKDTASLKLEEQPRTRLHLASCERRSKKYIDALKDLEKALNVGIKRNDTSVMRISKEKISDLIPAIPHVTFDPPSGVSDLQVRFDDRPVPAEALRKKFSIDPGKHSVHAEGRQNNIALTYDEDFDVKDGELLVVHITLKAAQASFLTQGQFQCMQAAKSQDEVQKCLPQHGENLVIRAGFEMAGYTDTNHVHVLSPSINGSVTSPTSGWNVGGSYLIDFVTAASPDIVSMASRRYTEQRHAATLSGGYKPGLYGVSAHANVSSEPDYLSLTAGGAITGDFHDKLVTPRLAYSHSADTIGKNNAPFSVFHNTLLTNEFEGGVTVVMSPTSVLVTGITFSTERGDQSKLYRFTPMFTPALAGRIPTGATVDLVNFYRLPFRPIEQLPTERDRYAIAARFMHRFTTSTIRVEERIYYDTWGTKATSTDGRYIQDLGRYLRVWPHVRLHAQSAASFYQLAYSAIVAADGKITVPTYRSGDRELAPLVTVTAGGGSRIALGAPEGTTQFGLTISGDLMYTRFLNSLFVTTRTAFYGVVGFDAEFQ